ncbi:MAG TPA: hypothetical protein PKH39_18605 [Woeseiaceae bacterium]|nr:hypothetical protein [Woeseiaceae bacterium]
MKRAVLKLLVLILLTANATNAEDLTDAPQTGFFALSFTPLELLGSSSLEDASAVLDHDDELSWQLFVPDDYDPVQPAGVVVYVSPTKKGGPPRAWSGVLGQGNLIWVGANNSGNRVALSKRMLLAMLAPKIVAARYAVNVDRIYIAGFSGGGKTAGFVMAAKPDLFRGGIYIGGAEMWRTKEPPPLLDIVRQNHHVFLTGTEDFNEHLTRRVYAAYKSAGVENCELIVERRHGHQLPSIGAFSRAIEYLDSRSAVDIAQGAGTH